MQYDIVMMGHISKDIIIDETGNESKLYGGALLYSSIAAARAGAHVLAITKVASEDFCALDMREGAEWYKDPDYPEPQNYIDPQCIPISRP